jgi:hypothetical protein
MLPIDEKYRIFAVNTSTNDIHDENDGFFMYATNRATLPMLDYYKAACRDLGCGEGHIQSIEILEESIRLLSKGIIPGGIVVIDRKFRFLAVSVQSDRIGDEKNGIFFSAADKAILPALRAMNADRDRLGFTSEWTDKNTTLIDRIEAFQLQGRSKIPDTSVSIETKQGLEVAEILG